MMSTVGTARAPNTTAALVLAYPRATGRRFVWDPPQGLPEPSRHACGGACVSRLRSAKRLIVSAVQNALIGPSGHLLQRKQMSAIGRTAKRAADIAKPT